MTRGYDPDLFIRGRYVNISLVVKADKVFTNFSQPQGTVPTRSYASGNVDLTVENGFVVAIPADHYTGITVAGPELRDGEWLATVSPPVVFFLPEHAADPLRSRLAGTLFVEVTLPRSGPPRPIRLGTKVGGQIIPLGN